MIIFDYKIHPPTVIITVVNIKGNTNKHNKLILIILF